MSHREHLKIVPLLVGAFLTTEVPSQAQDRIIAGLKGKVQTVLTEDFTTDDGVNRKANGSTLEVYDSAGYKLQSFLYKSDGSLWAHTVYYRNGPRIFRVDVTGVPDNDGTRIAPFEPHSEQTVYDAKGREIEYDLFDANGLLVTKTTNTFVQQGPNSDIMYQHTEKKQGTASTAVTNETTDPQTGITHQVTTKNGRTEVDWLIQRNPDGTQKDKAVEPDGSYTESERNSGGGIIAQHTHDAATRTDFNRKVNAQGHTTERIEKSESRYLRSEYSFDVAGRQTGQTDYDASGNMQEKTTAEYRDDFHGNWIEKKSIVWNTKTEPMQPKTITFSVRTINYY